MWHITHATYKIIYIGLYSRMLCSVHKASFLSEVTVLFVIRGSCRVTSDPFVHFGSKYKWKHRPAAKYSVPSITVANRNIDMVGSAWFVLKYVSLCDIMSNTFLAFSVILFTLPVPVYIIAALNGHLVVKMVFAVFNFKETRTKYVSRMYRLS